MVRAKQGRTEDAVIAFRRAVELRRDWVEAHANLAAALKEQGDVDGLAAALWQSAALRPDDPATSCNLGLALLGQHKLDEAVAALSRAVALKPDFAEGYLNLGVAYDRQGNFEAATGALRRSISLRSDLPEAHVNLGNFLHQQGNLDGSIAAYRQAVALRPDYAMAHFGLSLALLAKGEYQEGWREYEWRGKEGAEAATLPEFPQPLWEGQDVFGKTVLVYAEQGFGDTLQFVRYVPLVAQRGARVILAAPPSLLSLFGRLAGAAVVCGPGALPAFDYHCRVMSLPLRFDTRVDSIPAAIPYLSADRGKAAAWRRRLAALPGVPGPLRVGLVWAGNPRADDPGANAIDRRRSMTLGHLAALADVPGVGFVSLQKGEPAAQTRSPPPGLVVHDWTAELADFDDTAALIEALDLVISVDTAVVHLAGALGKPVWLLDRFDSCWRWLRDREDSPWYPTLRLFRQRQPGDWEGVVDRVAAALKQLACS